MSPSDQIRFDGQTAIVTGAARGHGRAYAEALAARGAAVVVNDYGGDPFGSGPAGGPAEEAAAAIRAAGGLAVADGHAVGEADAARAIVQAALDAFGRIDILINNAGISAPGPLESPTDEQAERVVRTNLLGPYHLTRAVWPIMTAQGYGRILNVSSNACLGMGRSAPYAMSKAGLLGLTVDNAREGEAAGIKVNAVMPTAYSRMIDAAPDKAFVAWMRDNMPAEKVVAAVLYLVSGECEITGQILSVGGGRVARIAYMAAAGIFDPEITPESVRDRIAEATSMDEPILLNRHEDAIRLLGMDKATPSHSGG